MKYKYTFHFVYGSVTSIDAGGHRDEGPPFASILLFEKLGSIEPGLIGKVYKAHLLYWTRSENE